MSLILVVLLILLLVGAWPAWQWHSLGYTPSSLVFVLLIIVIVLLLTGHL